MNSVLESRTGGDPDVPDLVFTDMTPVQLETRMEELGTPVSDDTIRSWLDDQNVRLRKIRKDRAGGEAPDRNLQFEIIAELFDRYVDDGNPILSVDTKAKEFQGHLFRKGRAYCSRPFVAFDHDFPSWADGVIIPHGIYDPIRNRGHINIGLSHDTTQFACDSLKWYWNRIGQQCYPSAKSILLLVDCGGSNSANKYIFKHDLQAVATEIGIEFRVAHYPSYCSKYNLIERRFFPHVSRACTGMLFDTLQRAIDLMRRATTSTGLQTTVNVITRIYEMGRKATQEMIARVKTHTIFHDTLPKWNYTIAPQ